MKDEGIAKVLALKAFLTVKQAALPEHAALRAKAERAVRFLQSQDTLNALRRRIFYNLVLAELLRYAHPIPFREAAADDGKRLTERGYADPTPIYLRIVDATTERLTTAHFGDFKSSPHWSHSRRSNSPLAQSQAFQGSVAPALAAAQLDNALEARYEKFLRETPLDEIMKEHGIA